MIRECTFKRKILRVVFAPLCIEGKWKTHVNQKLYSMCKKALIFQNVRAVRWLENIVRMDNNSVVKRVFENIPDAKCRRCSIKWGWTIANSDERIFHTFERKVLRVIFGPICIDDEWRTR